MNTTQDIIIEGALLAVKMGLADSPKVEKALTTLSKVVGSFEAGTESAARVRQVALAYVHEIERGLFSQCNQMAELETMADISADTFESYLQLVRDWSRDTRNAQIELRIAQAKKARA